MKTSCYKLCNNWKLLRDGFLSLLILIVIAFILGWITNILPIKWINIQHTENVWDTWAYYLTAAGTAILAAIAYFKAESIQKDNISEFLLRIDERWGSEEIIKARKIIHKIYTKASKTVKETYQENGAKEDIYQMVSKEIRSISDGSQKEKTDGDFIDLLNLLDFMETIAFLEAEGRVTKEKLDALCGKSLIFNYRIFEDYIRHKRKKHNDEEYFQNFENLYNKLTTSKNNKSYE